MPAIDMLVLCIPAECDNIKKPYNGEIASRWDACLLCDICRHFASVMLHFASLISHNLRCIPAYSHQIPTGFFKSLLNYHRDTLYIIAFTFVSIGRIGLIRPIGHQLVDLLTRWPVDFLMGGEHKKKSGTREGARPEWSYSIDMCQIKLIRALDQQLREPYQLHCFRT